MTGCRNNVDGRCTLGLYGGRPSDGVCARCDKYDGPMRGLGDAVKAAADKSGVTILVNAVTKGNGCGGCKKRREEWNAAMPFRKVI